MIDQLLSTRQGMGDYSTRTDYRDAIIYLQKLMPKWLTIVPIMSGKSLLKMSKTHEMSLFEVNNLIKSHFEEERDA
jgi:hypothetical protein